eukprot:5736719-Amphidinium_carterae.1
MSHGWTSGVQSCAAGVGCRICAHGASCKCTRGRGIAFCLGTTCKGVVTVTVASTSMGVGHCARALTATAVRARLGGGGTCWAVMVCTGKS